VTSTSVAQPSKIAAASSGRGARKLSRRVDQLSGSIGTDRKYAAQATTCAHGSVSYCAKISHLSDKGERWRNT
jgi:hypothetical protein